MVVLGIAAVAVGVGAAIGLFRAGDEEDARSSATYPMAGVSMEPTFGHGDPVTAREIDGDEVGRGEVVILEVPDAAGGSDLTVKRVVAVAGDEIASVDDELRVNGEAVAEPYLAPGTPTTDLAQQRIPAGHVFVMGDNRHNSHDSRLFGPVPTGSIVAVVEPS